MAGNFVIAALRRKVANMEKDKARLDWLDAQGNGDPWIARQSTTGRGYRLHNDTDFGAECQTVRDAIDAAMREATA